MPALHAEHGARRFANDGKQMRPHSSEGGLRVSAAGDNKIRISSKYFLTHAFGDVGVENRVRRFDAQFSFQLSQAEMRRLDELLLDGRQIDLWRRQGRLYDVQYRQLGAIGTRKRGGSPQYRFRFVAVIERAEDGAVGDPGRVAGQGRADAGPQTAALVSCSTLAVTDPTRKRRTGPWPRVASIIRSARSRCAIFSITLPGSPNSAIDSTHCPGNIWRANSRSRSSWPICSFSGKVGSVRTTSASSNTAEGP